MKRIISVVLLTVFLISLGSYAFAVEMRASELISVTGVTIAPLSGGTISVTARVTATGVVDQVGFTSIKIQVYTGSAWSTVKTVSNKFAYNSVSNVYSTSYSGTAGKKYRAVVNYKVVDNGASDTRTRTSTTVTAG